ncbi:MAG: CO dehydrogenase/acetyl-CoA synthase subunit delta [Candidatus Helarchaeota archaeon]
MAEELKKLTEEFRDAQTIVLKNIEILAKKLNFTLARSGAVSSAAIPSFIQGAIPGMAQAVTAQLKWQAATFKEPVREFPGKITEVTLMRSGRGGKKITIGGQKSMNFYNFDALTPHAPVVSADVFDLPINTKQRPSALRLAKPVKMHFLEPDVSTSPAEWAKLSVKLGADMITFHMISTDPTLPKELGGKRDVKKAAKDLEDVLQAVDVPVVIGGSGNEAMDYELFKVCAEVAEAERGLISSTNIDDYKKIVPLAQKYDHNVLAFTQLDLNNAKKLNAEILKLGFPQDHIVMDPTCAPLGYGLQYSFSIYQRIRLAALKGENEIANPMSGGTTNAWGAREAFLSVKKMPHWGPVEYRGPLWEVLSAFLLSIAGLDLAMMLHPGAIQSFKQVGNEMTSTKKAPKPNYLDWIKMDV